MLVSLTVILIGLILIFRRMSYAKKPLYLFKLNFFNDRIFESLIIIICITLTIFNSFNNYMVNKTLDFKSILIITPIILGFTILAIFEYNKNKVGIYENGLLLKSQFYKWDKIYTYRVKNMTDGSKKILFYFYDRADEEKLNISSFLVDENTSEEIIKAIGENLDPSRE